MNILPIIYGIVWKNLQGYLTKKGSGTWNWKKAVPDVFYGVAAGVIVYGLQFWLGISVTEDAILSSALFMGLTHAIDKWWNAVAMKFNLFGKGDSKFNFFN